MEKDTWGEIMIYIIKHKEYNNPVPKQYKEKYVGEMFKYDYKKDNINKFNPYINEATGLYDIWRNNKDDVIGLVHYRRFFWNKENILSFKDAKLILKDYDMIIPHDVIFNKGIYEQLRSEIENPDVLDKYYNKLIKEEPQLKEWFEFKSFNPKEMFVCKRDVINDYCRWLFPLILPIVDEFIKEDADKVINKRMIGHLVERLFAYWIWKNKLKVYKMDIKEV